MDQHWAYQQMLAGYKVRNQYYSPEEYAFINANGDIETEDGCIMGSQYDEFWFEIQSNPSYEWSIYIVEI